MTEKNEKLPWIFVSEPLPETMTIGHKLIVIREKLPPTIIIGDQLYSETDEPDRPPRHPR